MSYINRDVSYKVPDNRGTSYINRGVSCKDSYLLFRNKYLISNVVNSRPEDSRPLHSYKLKVQGTTIIGMLDSGAQINCVSQHIVQKHKFPVYLYDTPIKLGMAIEGEKTKSLPILRSHIRLPNTQASLIYPCYLVFQDLT